MDKYYIKDLNCKVDCYHVLFQNLSNFNDDVINYAVPQIAQYFRRHYKFKLFFKILCQLTLHLLNTLNLLLNGENGWLIF